VTPTAFGYGGVGGSFAYADTSTRIAFALTKNRLNPDFAVAQQVDEIVTKVVADS
jgi:CubicO group peptidase (beta-lactamase class C family)